MDHGPFECLPVATAMVAIHSTHAFSQLPDTHWRWIAAHEIGHQYWMEHVLTGEPEQGWGWLMIGLDIWDKVVEKMVFGIGRWGGIRQITLFVAQRLDRIQGGGAVGRQIAGYNPDRN
jgi:hypothetical protein